MKQAGRKGETPSYLTNHTQPATGCCTRAALLKQLLLFETVAADAAVFGLHAAFLAAVHPRAAGGALSVHAADYCVAGVAGGLVPDERPHLLVRRSCRTGCRSLAVVGGDVPCLRKRWVVGLRLRHQPPNKERTVHPLHPSDAKPSANPKGVGKL